MQYSILPPNQKQKNFVALRIKRIFVLDFTYTMKDFGGRLQIFVPP